MASDLQAHGPLARPVQNNPAGQSGGEATSTPELEQGGPLERTEWSDRDPFGWWRWLAGLHRDSRRKGVPRALLVFAKRQDGVVGRQVRTG